MIERTFQEISEGKLGEAIQPSYLNDLLGQSQVMTWEDLLRSQRILLISEAGSGKTYECEEQAKRLWNEGKPAFFIELTELENNDLPDLLGIEEHERFDSWLSSQSETATFFLDSIDELKLSLRSFERALKRLKKGIHNQLDRARIIITTRPIKLDEKLIRDLLPIPPKHSLKLNNENDFAKVAMRDHQDQSDNKENVTPEWQIVSLMPLSNEQIVEFSKCQGVQEPKALLNDLEKRHAQEFAQHPQELIALCADWKVNKRIRNHYDQVNTSTRVKLLPRDNRAEPAELSPAKAIDGASRLALAMHMSRRWTIRHTVTTEDRDKNTALDPQIILSNWTAEQHKTLLERSLFGFASYHRVRFHHRSIIEYLAAQRLLTLRKRGMSFSALKRLLFAETKGKTIVRPSKRPIAGWLALQERGIFELLRDNEPAVLLDEGDPASLTQTQRNQALKAYVTRYGSGGWRRLTVPFIQIHRFASPELADEIKQIWRNGIENPEVRETLLRIIETGRISACADIAHEVLYNPKASTTEQVIATQALVALDDARLHKIAASISTDSEQWSDRVAQNAALNLFPKYMSVEQLNSVLRWLPNEKNTIGNLSWRLPRLISKVPLDSEILESLRDGLVSLVSEKLIWDKSQYRITGNRQHLNEPLAATCLIGLKQSKNDAWLYASILATRLNHRDYHHKDSIKKLREVLGHLDANDNARLFWLSDQLMQSLNCSREPWKRLTAITFYDSPVSFRPERDLQWIKKALGEPARDIGERAMLLEAAMRLKPGNDAWQTQAQKLKPLISDSPALIEKLNVWLQSSKCDKEARRWEKHTAKRKVRETRKQATARASWIQFWREIANHSEQAFSPENSWNTAYNLWNIMRQNNDDDERLGWNRHFIETYFDKKTADQLRLTLMHIWRKDRPTLPSERPDNECNKTLTRWDLGLAAIYAEAEDPAWASKLNLDEAILAARYAPIQFSGLPAWLEPLIAAHPDAVDHTLGKALIWELNESINSQHHHPSLLQSIGYTPTTVTRHFIPRLESWLADNCGDDKHNDETLQLAAITQQVANIILKHGDNASRERLRKITHQQLLTAPASTLSGFWLPILIQLAPEAGIRALEQRLAPITPSKDSEAVTYLASLFNIHCRDTINLKDKKFTPQLLLRLLRLAYQHIRIEDDIHREGTYSPGIRADAQDARNEIVNALLDTKGETGWAAKLEMAADPLCVHFKDRILAIAEENWAQEIDSEVLNEEQVSEFERTNEMPLLTSEAMFAVMKDRLFDIDHLLLSDVSPREAWAMITDEKLMRREITRELNNTANGLYNTDQEAATADEKKTDIRLRSTKSQHEAVIELKLADERSARDLRDTINNQLVKKYMAADNCRAGTLLVTIAKTRNWEHPDTGKLIKLDKLHELLKAEANRVQASMAENIKLHIHILDLRLRLPIEKNATLSNQ